MTFAPRRITVASRVGRDHWQGGEKLSRALSVIVPAFNEAGNLESAVRDTLAASRHVDALEVIVVNDGSTDATGEIAERLVSELPGVRALHHARNRGFAAAYKTGLAEASLEYVTFVPGDNEVAPESLEAIFAAVGTADLVVPYHATPWLRTRLRRLLTWACTAQINALFGWRMKYYQGPTVYPTMLARRLPVTTDGFFFATEMLVHARAAGCSYVHVGLRHQERVYGTSKAVAFGNIIKAERVIFRLWRTIRLAGRRLVAEPANRDQPILEAVDS